MITLRELRLHCTDNCGQRRQFFQRLICSRRVGIVNEVVETIANDKVPVF